MNYEEIANLIEKGELEQAQKELDNDQTVSAEWFYLQSWIQYELGWYLDSKNNLEQALLLDPDNELYRDRYERLLKQGETDLDEKETIPEKSKEDGKSSKSNTKTSKYKVKNNICGDCCQVCGEGCCQGLCEGLCEMMGSGC